MLAKRIIGHNFLTVSKALSHLLKTSTDYRTANLQAAYSAVKCAADGRS